MGMGMGMGIGGEVAGALVVSQRGISTSGSFATR